MQFGLACLYTLNVCVCAPMFVFVLLQCELRAPERMCVSQHAAWPWWPCFGWLMCLREQRGAQVGPEPQSDTLLPPCCFTYVDAARLLLPSHLTVPPIPTQPTLTGSFFGGTLFLSSCLFHENKLAGFSNHFLFHSTSKRMPGSHYELNNMMNLCWGVKISFSAFFFHKIST